MAPPSTDFVAIHGHIHAHRSENMQWLKVASLPCKGRGYIAARFIPVGTIVHVGKPLAAVVAQEWTPETCAFCFQFTYPRRMKIKLTDMKDVCFCSQECHSRFLNNGYEGESDLVISSYRALDRAYHTAKGKLQQNHDNNILSDLQWTPKPPPPPPPPSSSSSDDNDDKALTQWLDQHVWAAAATDAARAKNATWVPANSERTMCRLMAACLARRQCEAAYLFQDNRHRDRLVPFSDIDQIQHNEIAYLRAAWTEDQQWVPDRIQEIIRLYIYFSSAVAGILDCPHQLFRAIYFRENANSFGLWEMPPRRSNNQGVTDDLELLGWGLYPSAVYFNHACDANIIKIRDGRNMQFIADRDIEPGQEACISYGSVQESVKERQQRLLENYHFLCACDRCKGELLASSSSSSS